MDEIDGIAYDAGSLSVDDINREIDAFRQELAKGANANPGILNDLKRSGIDIQTAKTLAESIEAEAGEPAFDLGLIIIWVGSTGVPMMIVHDLWKQVALPYIKHITKVDALGQERGKRTRKGKNRKQ